jgi:hypothetical protein
MPWECHDFIPQTASGKQKSPNQIHNELQHCIDNCSETRSDCWVSIATVFVNS